MTKWKGLLVILFVIFCSVYAKEFSASIDGYDRISDITLKLYISANSEYDIWSETHDEIEIVDGEFRIDIGSVNPLIEIDESTTYFVEIYIDGELSGTRRVIDLSDDSSESIFSTESSGGVILEELTPSLEIGDGVDDVIVLDGTDFGIGLATGTDASARLDVRGDDARFWDGSASVGYATGEGDVFIEDALEVDGTIYSSAYRSNDGSALLASELGSPITVTEESNGSWTIGMGSSGTGETYTFSNCGQTGRTGPSQTQANTTYSGTTLDGDVTVTSGIQYWTVPATGTYTISAYGAQGFAADATYLGGQGAYMSGEFNLTSGTVLKILVGQQGVGTIGANGGGGGGSFVTLSDNTPLVIAGGGGGTRETVDQNGCDAITSNYAVGGSGSATTSTCPRKTSSLGQGGIVSASSWGSAGGGLNSNGANDGSYGYGGSSYISGGLGGNYGSGSGSVGGFGCGGSGCGSNGGGGGGGYSGGDGGRVAGGGGSFMSATATLVDSASGARTGHGLVVIESSGGSGGLVENLNDLSDVNTSSPSNGDMLYFDGSEWTNLSAGTSGQFLTMDSSTPQWDDAPSASVVECVNPWDENEHGSLSTTSSYNGYTAGYEFTPSVDGQVTELGFYAYYSGTAQTVYLYNDVTGSLLGTVSVTPTSTGWHYAALATPVDLTAGTRYCVGVYKTTGTGYYRYSLTLPAAYGDITIHNAVYRTSSGWPTSTSGTSMYGLADITFCTSSDPISVSGASEGDLIYYDGSEWINLGVGDSAQVLTSNGSEPSWQFPDDGSVTTCVYPWDENEYGSITSTTSYQNYTSGYDFTSSVDGQVTELGFYAYYTGTAQTVYLYNDNTGSLLGSVAVTPTTTGWNYAELSSPINIAAGTRYCVCVYRSTYYGYYRYSLSFPNTYGDITIHNAAYRSGTGWPTSSNTSYMYGLADIKFCKTSGGSGSTETCVNPWNENEYGSINSTTSYQNYTSGYDFTPSVNGQVTELGFYAYYTGTAQTVYLYNDNTGSLLGSVSVTPTTTGWNYAALSTPISLTAGTRYCVCVYRSTYYGYYRYSLSFPDTYGDITIHNAAYRSGTGWPTNNNTAYMYGLADITFCTSDDESGDTDWTGAGSGTMFATDTSDNVAIGSSTATGKLDIRGDEVRVWDGTATVGYADGVGDVFVEDALEVDGTIYGSAYRDNAGGDLINAGTGISVTEESDGSWTVGLGSGSSIGADFYVTSMLATGYGVVDHSSYSGDDRGCIAITEDYYYYTGDTYTVRYNMPNLTSPVSYTRNDGLFSDLSGSGTLYTLWNGSAPPTYSFSSYTVTSIRTMNADLSYGAVTIPLSTSITVSGSASGVYSGYGFAILQTGSNFYLIEIPSGTVTSLGSFSSSRYNAETWANWGIAERNAGVYSVLYRSSIGSIVQRLNLSTGAVTTLATFTNLSDMASITYAPWYNRWYFHHEGTSQFGGSSETAGYANGTHIVTTSSGGGLLIGDLADVDSSSATEGDILYYDGSEWTQLPIGSSGEYLRSDGSIPEWATGTSGGGVIVGDRTFYTTHGPSGGMENANYTYYYRMYYGNAGQGAPYVYSSSSESDDYVMSIPSPEIPDGGSLILDEIEFKFYHSSTVYSYYSVYADNVNWENSTGAPTSTALVNTNWYGSGYRTQTHTIDHEMDSNEAIRITWDNSSSGTNYRFYGVRCKWTIEGIDTGGTGGTGLYSFTNHTFSNCSATGRTGPTLSACRSAYTTAWDDTYLNMTTQGIQEWTVPATGSYRITAAGAAGGRQTYSSGYNGGRGAVISGTFSLTEGETIYILCGQKGEDTRMSADNAAPGGGGGTYVYRSASATYPLIAAGGGGSGARCTSVSGIQDASYTTSGNRSGVLLNGGTSGNGGTTNAGGSSYWAGGGSGWLTDGTGGNVSTNYSYNGSHGDGGRAPRNSGVGGVRYSDGTDEGGDGGFGGGGGGGSDNMGGGGGGGYSGGGGSRSGGCGNEPGGGGGSYNSGTSSSNDGYNTGHGYVTIEKL